MKGTKCASGFYNRTAKKVPRRTLRRLTADELAPGNDTEAEKPRTFTQAIKQKLGDSITLGPYKRNNLVMDEEDQDDPHAMDWNPDTFTPYAEEEGDSVQPMEAGIVDADGKRLNQQSANDLLINAEVLLPEGEHKHMAKVIMRAVDENGQLIGSFDEVPALNTLLYDVEFPDGALKQYAANVIAENILYQVDHNGRHSHVLEGVIDHRRAGSAVGKEDAYVVTRRGQRKLRQMTIGWELQVQWRDGTKQWVPLKVLKESNPVKVAIYARAKGIDGEPAF